MIRGDVLLPGGAIERREASCPIQVIPGDGGRVEPDVRREMLLVQTARAREEAFVRNRHGDYRGAAHVLRETVAMVWESGFDDVRMTEEAEDLQTMSRAARAPMSPADQKYLFQRAHEASRSRKAWEKITRMKGEE